MKNYEEEILNEIEVAANKAIEKLQAAKDKARADAIIAVAHAVQGIEDDICFAFSETNMNLIYYLNAKEVVRLAQKVTESLPLSKLNKIARSNNPIWRVRELLSIEDEELIRSCSDYRNKDN